jgi:hypothetical protein
MMNKSRQVTAVSKKECAISKHNNKMSGNKDVDK